MENIYYLCNSYIKIFNKLTTIVHFYLNKFNFHNIRKIELSLGTSLRERNSESKS